MCMDALVSRYLTSLSMGPFFARSVGRCIGRSLVGQECVRAVMGAAGGGGGGGGGGLEIASCILYLVAIWIGTIRYQ